MDEPDFMPNGADVCADESAMLTRSQTDENDIPVNMEQPMMLGEKLPNPYSVENMRRAYRNLPVEKRRLTGIAHESYIRPNTLYVRFLPADSTQYRILVESELELFDYPLDYEILEEGGFYHDPSLEGQDYTWQYTTVPIGFKFFDGITYEILDRCFMYGETFGSWWIGYISNSDCDETTMSGESADIDVVGGTRPPTEEQIMILEEQAWIDAGEEPSSDPSITRFSKIKPSGNFYVQYNDTLTVPLKGVKIRCHKGVKHASAYTDENGHYEMPRKFGTDKVRYTMVFENQCGFKLWGPQYGFLSTARKKYKKHEKNYGKTVKMTDDEWEMCVVNNAAYDHYNYCLQNRLPQPPDDMRIWVRLGDNSINSAPMFRHINNEAVTDLLLANGFMLLFGDSGFVFGGLYYPADLWLKWVLPDIFISCDGRSANSIYKTVSHEMMHASHFSNVGQPYWKRYIKYIVNCATLESLYGYRGRSDSGVCISETMAYAMGYKREEEMFGVRRDGIYPTNADYWFKPQILYNLMRDKRITPEDIFACLTVNIDEHKLFLKALLQRYNNSYFTAHAIWQEFADNGFEYPDLEPEKPDVDGGGNGGIQPPRGDWVIGPWKPVNPPIIIGDNNDNNMSDK